MVLVLVDYYDCSCACGWTHRVIVGGGTGAEHAREEAWRIHNRAVTVGRLLNESNRLCYLPKGELTLEKVED